MPYVGIILAVLIIVFQQAIRNYTADIVGTILVRTIKDATKGNYTIRYSLVRFDIITNELRINDLSLTLDTTVTERNAFLQSHANLLNISTPVVVLKLKSLFQLIANDKLLINYVGMQNPGMALTRSNRKTRSLSESQQNTRNVAFLIQNYFKSLEIDSIQINNASFELYQGENKSNPDFRIGHLTTMVKDFRVDPEAPNHILQGMSANYLDLEIKNQDIVLRDQNQKISFKKLQMSSFDSLILVDSLSISTINKTKGGFDVVFPHVNLENVDYSSWFFNNKIHARKLVIQQPDISVNMKHNEDTPKPDGSKMVRLIEGFDIDQLIVKQGVLDIQGTFPVHIGRYDLELNQYRLDSSKISHMDLMTEKLDLQAEMEEVEWSLPDSIHQFSTDHLMLKTYDSVLRVMGFHIKPIKTRRGYQLLKHQGVPSRLTVNGRLAEISGFDFNELLNHQRLKADSLTVENTRGYITTFPSIKRIPLRKKRNLKLSLNQMTLLDNYVRINSWHHGLSHISEFMGLDLGASDVELNSINILALKNVDITSSSGQITLPEIGHTLTYSHLNLHNWNKYFVKALQIKPDSADLPLPQYSLKLANVLSTKFNPIGGRNMKSIQMDTLIAETLDLDIHLKNGQQNQLFSTKPFYATYTKIGSGNISFRDQNIKSTVHDIRGEISHLVIDPTAADTLDWVKFDSLNTRYKTLTLELHDQGLKISSGEGRISDIDSLISFTNVRVSNQTVNQSLMIKRINIKKLQTLNFLNHKQLLFRSAQIRKIRFDGLLNQRKRLLSINELRDQWLGVIPELRFDSLVTSNGSLNLRLNNASSRIQAKDFSGAIYGYSFDSTMEASQLFKPRYFQVGAGALSYISKTDTITINAVSSNLISGQIKSGALDARIHMDQAITRMTAKYIQGDGIDLIRVMGSNFSFNNLAIGQSKLELTLNKSGLTESNETYEQLLKHRLINLLSVDDQSNKPGDLINKDVEDYKASNQTASQIPSSFAQDTITTAKKTQTAKEIIQYLQIPNIDFRLTNPDNPNSPLKSFHIGLFANELDMTSIDGVKSADITAKIYNKTIHLPDSLNTIHFDTLSFSSGKRNVELKNLSLTSRVDKFQYAERVGHQVNWSDLKNLDLSISGLNFKNLIQEKSINADHIKVHRANLSLFRDKNFPFPEDQVREMPQVVLHKLKTPVKVDTVSIDRFNVDYSMRLTPQMSIGHIRFNNIQANAYNITNIDSLIQVNPAVRINASCKLMNEGLLTTNFTFLLHDPDNRFIFDAHLTKMGMKAFNSILEASAFVTVNSGEVKSVKLKAEGDENYALGKMTFLYNNLKISTINKKNLKTTGMGKVIKTFFANAFVVKKNNPNYKIFPREGDMYYERNPQKAIFDYAEKTAMSGVVSSIGGRSNRKEIKRIQKESQQLQEINLQKQRKKKSNSSGNP